MSNTSTAKRGHRSPLNRVNVGALRSICQRAVMRREKSTSSEMMSTVGACTSRSLSRPNSSLRQSLETHDSAHLHFFFPGCSPESSSHPGAPETSNSGASPLGTASLGLTPELGATTLLFAALDAPAAAAVTAGFATA